MNSTSGTGVNLPGFAGAPGRRRLDHVEVGQRQRGQVDVRAVLVRGPDQPVRGDRPLAAAAEAVPAGLAVGRVGVLAARAGPLVPDVEALAGGLVVQRHADLDPLVVAHVLRQDVQALADLHLGEPERRRGAGGLLVRLVAAEPARGQAAQRRRGVGDDVGVVHERRPARGR
jgi:hypothetical protein